MDGPLFSFRTNGPLASALDLNTNTGTSIRKDANEVYTPGKSAVSAVPRKAIRLRSDSSDYPDACTCSDKSVDSREGETEFPHSVDGAVDFQFFDFEFPVLACDVHRVHFD